MAKVSRRDLLLMVLAPDGPKAPAITGGITRLQKLLFLLENEEGLRPDGDDFDFTAYKAGPYSSKLYDDLEFLENLGLLKSQVKGQATEPEAAEIDELTFDELIGSQSLEESSPDAYEERAFALTENGIKHVRGLMTDPRYQPLIEKIRRIKSRFATYSLNDLLYYVYTKYPQMTVESEIKDQVLRRARRS